MMYDSFIYAVGLCVVFASTVCVVVFMLAIAASWINGEATKVLHAIKNTYWWIRWIRWHSIARARKGTK